MAASALVVEDHPLYRDALRQLLDRIFGADRVCAAASAEEGLRQAAAGDVHDLGSFQDHLGDVIDEQDEALDAHLDRLRRMTDVEMLRAEAVEAVIVNDGLVRALKRRGEG